MLTSTLLLACASGPLLAAAQADYGLPVVDMGVSRHQAIAYDSDGDFYTFSNIRYAEPPVGKLRFAAAVSPKPDRTVRRGEEDRICPQANPAWFTTAARFLPTYLAGDASALNSSLASNETTLDASQLPPSDPRESEDCLFLDVVVPKAILDERGRGGGAPVLVWIHSGGFVVGSKNADGSPAGLIARSQDDSSRGVIYVALNYRLGAFGFLAGSILEAGGGVSNAGLLDQRLALLWIQRRIKFFGGDPKRVTVLGMSAGGGSIMHHMTARGARGRPLPFQQAILQSPGFEPMRERKQMDRTLQDFYGLLGVDSLEEARAKSGDEVRQANALQVGRAPYGSFVYGPVVDGSYVQDLPGQLLLEGAFAQDVRVMTGHSTNEGLFFSPPFVRTDRDLVRYLEQRLPQAAKDAIDFVTDSLYPPVFDGSEGYSDQLQRAAAILGDLAFSCNTNYLARAYGNLTYNYLFSVPPALHASDLPYTFFNNPTPQVVSSSVAVALQNYITSFAMTGTPNEPGVPQFNIYGPGNRVQNLNITGIDRIRDPAASERCIWWQEGLSASPTWRRRRKGVRLSLTST